MTNRSRSCTLAAAGLALILPAAAHAQSYTIAWFTVDGGGGSASSGSYALSGTIGQPDASGELSGGAYSLAGGFFPADTPLPALSVADLSLTEGNSGTTNNDFTVSLSFAYSQPVTVAYVTADGSASSTSDYTASSGTLTFNPGQATRTVSVSVTGDLLNEADETLFLGLSSPSNASISDAQATGTIQNDDPTPSLAIGDVTVPEGNTGSSPAAVPVLLSAPSGRTVTVNFATADATASAGSDYDAASGVLTFNPGEIAKVVSVPVRGDTQAEANESLQVNLSAASFASLADAQGLCTIADDDTAGGAARFSIDDRDVSEGAATTAAFRVSLSAPVTSGSVTVQYGTADGTAMSVSDYSATSGTLTFPPGRTQHSIFVPIVSDTTGEGTESFYVNLTDPTGGAGVLDGQAVATIGDPPTAAKSAMYRSYNKSTDYHFFTTDLASKNFAVGVLGFQDESNPIPFYVWNVQQTGTVPLFRMYNPNLGRHFYTASSGSRDFLMGIGALYEKEEGFVFPLSTTPVPSGTTELFLLYNNNSGTHLFTADPAQKDGILSLFAGIWVQHTSVGFVFTSP